MTEDVKRPYHSPLRDQHAEVTRSAILDAAHRLFLADGYAATPVSKIAETAGVSDRTIYNAFGDKPTLLYEVGNRVVSGQFASDETTSDLAAELNAEPDPIQRVKMVASWSRMVWEQGMLQFESMLLDAAANDQRAAKIVEQAWRQKYDENRRLFALAIPKDARRYNLDVDEALDVLFAIDSAAFVRILIEDRGWTYDRYEAWLATILQQLFLEPT